MCINWLQIESTETEISDLEMSMVQEREKFTLEKNNMAQQAVYEHPTKSYY